MLEQKQKPAPMCKNPHDYPIEWDSNPIHDTAASTVREFVKCGATIVRFELLPVPRLVVQRTATSEAMTFSKNVAMAYMLHRYRTEYPASRRATESFKDWLAKWAAPAAWLDESTRTGKPWFPMRIPALRGHLSSQVKVDLEDLRRLVARAGFIERDLNGLGVSFEMPPGVRPPPGVMENRIYSILGNKRTEGMKGPWIELQLRDTVTGLSMHIDGVGDVGGMRIFELPENKAPAEKPHAEAKAPTPPTAPKVDPATIPIGDITSMHLGGMAYNDLTVVAARLGVPIVGLTWEASVKRIIDAFSSQEKRAKDTGRTHAKREEFVPPHIAKRRAANARHKCGVAIAVDLHVPGEDFQ